MSKLLHVIAICCILSHLPPAKAESAPGEIRAYAHPTIRELDRQLILEGIKLGRFNIYYRNNANQHYRWKSFIYPAVQEAGTALSFTNTLIDLSQRAQNIQHPSLIDKSAQRQATYCGFTGQAIKGSEFVFELLQNMRTSYVAGNAGYSPDKAVEFVSARISNIDRMLQERQKLVESEAPDDKILALEGRMMRHLRNQLLYEFKLFSTSSRERMWQENVFYGLAATQNFTSMAASIATLKAFQASSYTQTSAITGVTASSIGVVAPIARNLVGIGVRKYWQARLDKVLPSDRPTPRGMEQLEADWKDLDDYRKDPKHQSTDASTVLGLDALIRRSQRADSGIESESNRIASLRRVAQEQSFVGPAIEMATLSRQICQESAYYNRRNSHLSNRINLAGRISQISGQGYSLVSTPYTAITAYMIQQKLRKRQELPSQLLSARLKKLEDLETRVNALHIVPK